MTRTAIIRADAGPGIGGGHVMRCLALAHALVPLGWAIAFACRAGTVESTPDLAASGFALLPLDGPEDAEAQAMATHVPYGCDLVIVDHYRRNATFENACRTFASAVTVLDDMPGHRTHAADVLIDAAPGRTADDWRDVTEADHILAGVSHALIRPEITAQRLASLARRRAGLSRILISFGLADSANATVPALRAARAAFPEAHIDVVIGATSVHGESVREEANRQDAVLHVAPPDYVDLLVAADLAIGAGGVSALERACLGVPSVVVETADNQRDGIAALEQAGAIIRAGGVKDLGHAWPEGLLASVPARLTDLSARAAALVDGDGAARVAHALDTCVEASDPS